MDGHKSRKNQFDPINRILDGVGEGAKVIKKKARSLSRETEKAVETFQNFSNESQSLVSKFQNILLEEPLQVTRDSIKELKMIYMKIFYSILSMWFGQKIGEYVIFQLFNQLIDSESSILLSYIVIPVIIILKYFPLTNKNDEKEKLSERLLYIYSILIGMILGFVFIILQTNSVMSYGIINASVLFSYFNVPEFALSINNMRKNQIIVCIIGPLSMIIISPIMKDSFIVPLLSLLFYSCLNFISFQVYTNYKAHNIKGTPTAIILINIISEIYILTVLSLIN